MMLEYDERLAAVGRESLVGGGASLLNASLNSSLWALIPKAIQEELTSLKADAKDLHRVVASLKEARLDASSLMEQSGRPSLASEQQQAATTAEAGPSSQAATQSSPTSAHLTFDVLERRLKDFSGALTAASSSPSSRQQLEREISRALASLLAGSDEAFRSGMAQWMEEWRKVGLIQPINVYLSKGTFHCIQDLPSRGGA